MMKFQKSTLKSNMDRFIALLCLLIALNLFPLKSNMDRFIASADLPIVSDKSRFKIQYG